MVDLSNCVGAYVVDTEGRHATVISTETKGVDSTVTLRLEEGAEITAPLSALIAARDGEYRLPMAFSAWLDNANAQSEIAIPVMQEEMRIDKRTVDTGKGLRVRKTVTDREHLIDQPLFEDELLVEHVQVGQLVAVSSLPVTRYEGDTLIVPVFEEVLIVEKRTRLKEELRITRRKREVHAPQRVALKSEQVSVERFDETNNPNNPDEPNEPNDSPGVPQSTRQVQSESGKSAG